MHVLENYTVKPLTKELLKDEANRVWYLNPSSTPYLVGNTALSAASLGYHMIGLNGVDNQDPLLLARAGMSAMLLGANGYRLARRIDRKKTASVWEPEIPIRDKNKVIEVATARKDPYIRDQIDNASKTELSLLEKHPDVANFAGNVAKTLGAGLAIGSLGYHIVNNATPSSDSFPVPSTDDLTGKLFLGGVGTAAVGRLLQEPTKRTLADVSDNNYIPTNADNVRTVMNQSYRMGDKQPGQNNYTIDVDKAYDKLQDLKKTSSTNSENMPERDSQTVMPNYNYPGTSIPERNYSIVVNNTTKVASILGIDKDTLRELLNMQSGTESNLSKVAGARVVTRTIGQAGTAPEAVNASPLSPTGDVGDYDVRHSEYVKEPLTSREMYNFIIPTYRR